MKSLLLRLIAICSPFVAAALLAVPAHAAPFAVYGLTPTQTFVNAQTEYTGTFESASTTVERCVLSIDGVVHGNMTLTGTPLMGTAKRTASIASAASHVVRITCYDDDAGTPIFSESTVTVFADASSPTVSTFTLTPPAPIAGASVTVQTSYDDTEFGSGMNTCGLIIDGVESGLMSLSGGVGSTIGTASLAVTVATAGSHSLMVNCFDRSGNFGTRTQSVSFSAPPDGTPPTVSAVSPSTAVHNVMQSYSVSFSDANSVSSCLLYVQQTSGSYNAYTMSRLGTSSGSASYSYSFSSAIPVGVYNMYATCTDASGNLGTGPTTGVSVSAVAATDTTAPVVSSINPSSATAGSSVNVSASFSDASGVISCSLYVDGSFVGTMDRGGTTSGTATRSYVFVNGTRLVEVRCNDAMGNTGSTSRNITVTTTGTPGPYTNRLVKLACPGGYIDPNHSCKAVYYVGSDGKRHAFPNERAYFTWYSNFDSVVELSSLATFELGVNATYRPGVRMVKFTTVDRVYAVGRGGVLRWMKTEGVARNLYGADWNRRIDDISDAFYTNYTFGADINNTADYNPTAETATVSNIDSNF